MKSKTCDVRARITEPMRRELEAIAEHRGEAMSIVVRDAIKQFLQSVDWNENEDWDDPERPLKPKAPTAQAVQGAKTAADAVRKRKPSATP